MYNLIKYSKLPDGRRDFIKKISAGSAGMMLGAIGMNGCSASFRSGPKLQKTFSAYTGESRVAFTKGNDRRDNLTTVLKPFENEIREGIKGKQIVIKLNCVGQEGKLLMVTHPDAVRALLDFLKPMTDRKIIVAESAVQNPGAPGWEEVYGYKALESEYNAKIVELNNEPTTYHWILNNNLYPIKIRVINTLLDPNNYVISVTRLKTHNSVVATLTLKNVVMGAPLKIPRLKVNDKAKMHAGGKTPKLINFNLFLMAQKVRPDFTVLDGFECVEGNGPANGTPVDHRIALAGPDFLSVDRIGTELMGIPFEDVGYLNYCATGELGQADRSRIKIIGPDIKDHIIKYKLHDNIEKQQKWNDELILQN